MSTFKIGVVGFSQQKFDRDVATMLLELGIGKAISECGDAKPVEIVSGLTNIGVPAIAYAIAAANDYRTVGIACEKAHRYECYPVEKEVIVGSELGDESDTFLDYVDVIVRVGGGEQSLREVATFQERGGKTYEYELNAV